MLRMDHICSLSMTAMAGFHTILALILILPQLWLTVLDSMKCAGCKVIQGLFDLMFVYGKRICNSALAAGMAMAAHRGPVAERHNTEILLLKCTQALCKESYIGVAVQPRTAKHLDANQQACVRPGT